MTESEKIFELDKIGVRFDQFIIATNGVLIAYSMKQIESEILTYKLIPIGFAIIFWVISFYFGISSIRRLISARILGVFKERDEIKTNSTFSEMSTKKFNQIAKKANRNNKTVYIFLYLGIIMFIIWQFLIITIRTYSWF